MKETIQDAEFLARSGYSSWEEVEANRPPAVVYKDFCVLVDRVYLVQNAIGDNLYYARFYVFGNVWIYWDSRNGYKISSESIAWDLNLVALEPYEPNPITADRVYLVLDEYGLNARGGLVYVFGTVWLYMDDVDGVMAFQREDCEHWHLKRTQKLKDKGEANG